jgi:hypothetical protein
LGEGDGDADTSEEVEVGVDNQTGGIVNSDVQEVVEAASISGSVTVAVIVTIEVADTRGRAA